MSDFAKLPQINCIDDWHPECFLDDMNRVTHLFTRLVLSKKIFIILGLIVAFLASSAFGQTVYVDQTLGHDNGTGSIGDPYKTIAKINSLTFGPGASILFKRGEIWRERLVPPSSGSAGNPITFGAYGSGASPIISADDILTGFTPEVVGGFTAYYKVVPVEPKQVFQDGVRYAVAGAKASLVTGSFYWDSGNSRVYVRTTGDNSPASFKIEATQRLNAIVVDSKDYVTIDGLHPTKGNWAAVDVINESDNFSIINSTIDYAYAVGVGAYSGTSDQTGGLIQSNDISYNGYAGIWLINHTVAWTIKLNAVHHNCLHNGDVDYTAGIKFNTGKDNIVEQNLVYSNGGPNVTGERGYGIWVDMGGPASGYIIRRNSVYLNRLTGIFVEVTSGVLVHHNVVYNNGTVGITTFGIAVCGRPHADDASSNPAIGNSILNNTIWQNTGNPTTYGIGVYNNSLTAASGTEAGVLIDNVFKNNIVMGFSRALVAHTGGENDGTMGHGNVYEYNSFGPEAPNFIFWGLTGNSYKNTYAEWETAYGGPTHSVPGDPLLTNPPMDFTLQPASPAINAGVNVGLTTDFDGKPIGH
jgi:hypothetical protein